MFVIVVLPSIFLLSPSLSMLNIKSVQLLVGEKTLQSSVSVFMGAPRFVTCWKCILGGQGCVTDAKVMEGVRREQQFREQNIASGPPIVCVCVCV